MQKGLPNVTSHLTFKNLKNENIWKKTVERKSCYILTWFWNINIYSCHGGSIFWLRIYGKDWKKTEKEKEPMTVVWKLYK